MFDKTKEEIEKEIKKFKRLSIAFATAVVIWAVISISLVVIS